MAASPQLTDELINNLKDLRWFAEQFFYISVKGADDDETALIPFKFNTAQIYLHNKLEAQLKATGRVRAIICKGRQQGVSTMVSARFFHKVITRKGYKTFIMTHHDSATNNLFNMVKTYFDNLPPGLCPYPTRLNTTEMYFDVFKGGYKVGTAGSKKVGRSDTIQLLHGSEAGLWDNTEEHSTGIFQTVADVAGTEIIIESTAQGIGNWYHKEWVAAVAGESEYMAIFIPWYWQPEYTASAEGMELTQDERAFMRAYSSDGLTIEHLAWRRNKMRNMSKDPERALELFSQEYPFNANDAFLNPVKNTFIPSKYVTAARKRKLKSEAGIVIGVDPADDKDGSDRTAIIFRQGRKAWNLKTYRNHNTMHICGKLVNMIKKYDPVKVFVDCIGIGKGIVDRMQEMGYTQVEGINVALDAHDKEHFTDRRAELWNACADWLMQDMPVEIPDSDELQSDLCSVGYDEDSSGRLRIESKKSLRKRGMPSPDCADALLHTFAAGYYTTTKLNPVKTLPVHARGKFI